jgi:ubiquinone/menaquinone biosynthesis C-methylase UbiE
MTNAQSPTDLIRPRFARMYMRNSQTALRRGGAEHRRLLLAGLQGTVIEVGAGSGLNFPYYTPTVTEVIATEPEPTLRAAAETAAAHTAIPIRVLAGVAEALPVEDATIDAVVASLVLCSVADQQLALGEIQRVLRPGGELRFYEHVIPTSQPRRALLQLADRSGIWPWIAGGCHPARDTAEAIRQAGFEIESNQRIMFAASRLEPAIPFIIGTARKP